MKELAISVFVSIMLFCTHLMADECVGNANEKHEVSWYEDNRVHMQVGLYNAFASPRLRAADQYLQELPYDVSIRHAKLDWRPPSWQSALPESGYPSLSPSQGDYWHNLLSNETERNKHTIGYYWLSAEGQPRSGSPYTELSPKLYGTDYDWQAPDDWFCEDKAGETIKTQKTNRRHIRGEYLDLASDYKYMVLKRLEEMVALGFSGAYFDSTHFPTVRHSNCYGSETEEAYRDRYMTDTSRNNEIDERHYAVHQGHILSEVFSFWRDSLDERFPGNSFVFVISGTYLAGFVAPQMNSSMYTPGSYVKIEYSHGLKDIVFDDIFRNKRVEKGVTENTMRAVAWALPRDLGAKPAHVWSPSHKTKEDALKFVADIVSHGNIAALHVTPDLAELNQRGTSTNDSSVVLPALKFGKQLSDILRDHSVLREYAIYVDEEFRDSFGSSEQAWRLYVSRVFKLYEDATRNGVSVGFVTREQIRTSNLDNVGTVLVLASSEPEIFSSLDRSDIPYVDMTNHTVNEAKGAGRQRLFSNAAFRVSGESIENTDARAVFHRSGCDEYIVSITTDTNDVSLDHEPVVLEFQEKPTKIEHLITGERLGVTYRPSTKTYIARLVPSEYIDLYSFSFQ